MEINQSKNFKQSHLSNSKKLNKMIFDSSQVNVPPSFFELRPINENQSNQQDIIFDPKSSSLKQIEDISKNSLHEFDKIIYEHLEQPQNESLFIECSKFDNSKSLSSNQLGSEQSSSYFQPSLKRGNPVSIKKDKSYKKIVKLSRDSLICSKRPKTSKTIVNQTKAKRNIVQSSQFQLINQYIELVSFASLIEQLIIVYGKNPLLEYSLDFDSENQLIQFQENPTFHNSQKFQIFQHADLNQQIKIQESEDSQKNEEKLSENDYRNQINYTKNCKKLYSEMEKLKISEASKQNKWKIIKEINFLDSKTYVNFFQPIQQLLEHVKSMSLCEKELFLNFKKQLKEIKDILDYIEKKKANYKKEHICKSCGQQFESGRQLGGHMSRKHPGKAIEYGFRKQLYKAKCIERNRRKYFKKRKCFLKLEDSSQKT